MIITKSPQHSDSTHSQNNLLTEPVMLIATIKKIRQTPVKFGIFWKIGIQKINRDLKSPDSPDIIPPGSDLDLTTFDYY